MPYVISAQGDELNKFVKEELSYFSRAEDWADYIDLVRKPTSPYLNWHESAINALFNITKGHPYFTKLLCRQIYRRAVEERDSDITEAEVSRAYHTALSLLDVNSFSHIWKDGIKGTRDQEEVQALQRCRFLVAAGRALRSGKALCADTIAANNHSPKLSNIHVGPLLNEFSRRGILIEHGSNYSFLLPLFADWLVEDGLNKLVADELGDELADAIEKAEQDAHVRPEEISKLVSSWGTYRGRAFTFNDVRYWLDQLGSKREQRILFTVLEHIRFFGELEVIDKLKKAHSALASMLPEFVRKVERGQSSPRTDIVITYLDGPAKSGAEYARLYAVENGIWAKSILEMTNFEEQLKKYEDESGSTVNGVVIFDDIIGTGDSLIKNTSAFLEKNRSAFLHRSMPLLVVAIAGTQEGVANVQRRFGAIKDVSVRLRVCEIIGSEYIAFGDEPGIWTNNALYQEAKDLCGRLGAMLVPKAPLGYGGTGLLVLFPRAVPNNTLPLLYAGGDRDGWKPLFPRRS